VDLLTLTTIVMIFELVPSFKGMVEGSIIPALVVTSINNDKSKLFYIESVPVSSRKFMVKKIII